MGIFVNILTDTTMTNKNKGVYKICISLLLITACFPKPSYQYTSRNLITHDSINLSYLLLNHHQETFKMFTQEERWKYGYLFAGDRLLKTQEFEPYIGDSLRRYPILSNYDKLIILDNLRERELDYRYIYLPSQKEVVKYGIRWHFSLQFGPHETLTFNSLYKDIKKITSNKHPYMITKIKKKKMNKWTIKTVVYLNRTK